jgi:hypothetical protein
VLAYIEENNDFIYWMEQQREFKLRHPSFQMTHDEALQKHRNEVGWSVAPVLIVIVTDGGNARRGIATILANVRFSDHAAQGVMLLSYLVLEAIARREKRIVKQPVECA